MTLGDPPSNVWHVFNIGQSLQTRSVNIFTVRGIPKQSRTEDLPVFGSPCSASLAGVPVALSLSRVATRRDRDLLSKGLDEVGSPRIADRSINMLGAS